MILGIISAYWLRFFIYVGLLVLLFIGIRKTLFFLVDHFFGQQD
jgi:hypothetical protein